MPELTEDRVRPEGAYVSWTPLADGSPMFIVETIYGDWSTARVTLTRAEAKHVIAELTKGLEEVS